MSKEDRPQMRVYSAPLRFVAAGVFAFIVLTAASVRGDVKLHGLFSDNMVLQRGMPVPVWGWADNGEVVTVEILGKSVKTTARDGKWCVYLPKMQAGGPYTLSVEGKNSIELENVLVGEVWICSGQSNMEWSLSGAFKSEADIENSSNARLRLYTVPKRKADEPVTDVDSSWVESNPDTVPGFSAVGYYFGRELQKALGIPVGLIHSSWGGSPAEVWMSETVLESNPVYKRQILDTYQEQLENFNKRLSEWEKKAEEAKNNNQEPPGKPWKPWKPAELYNGMIAPLLPYAIQGAIWYQGESNAGRAYQYRSLFADMIQNWRIDWGLGDFTFLEVQLAPWDMNRGRSMDEIAAEITESSWAELREAQLLATKVLPNVGMAVITDVGNKDDIHPKKKEPVGSRLALTARGIAYDEPIEYSGPVYTGMRVIGDKAIIEFEHTGKGLESRGGDLRGFTICGADREFVWADAEVVDDKVVVSSPKVPHPIAVRYGWADYPVVNLWNKNGLPATPFRTDNFPMVTGPR
ncbi:MAG: sialate O-acetylesterase [Verrucomicrobia bacterium]|nr:sialate O-acetylesterase [Verrucomicrobiota bacterium]MCF7708412.1 sialate O-acetylesterase [Verrucomicrobiota bacterium]